MEDLFNEIERGLDAGVYHLSLGIALCIPDICAGLQSDDGKTSGKKYKEWYNNYVADKLRLSADDCYYFRCSFLHQGSTQHEKSKYKKIIFIEPGAPFVLHNNVMNDVLNIDVRIFCKDLIESARQWLEVVKNDDNFIRNHANSFKRYPNGLPPYIGGVPVYG
ncbi:hypothetical protein BHL47_16430 [Bacillus cereus]|uniref:hypothetical protein n=1 Tax=Bacillus cereus TaxID=1396 RepID=UPI0009950E44|nr:hypothetical protein [Bacillus cereus]OPA28911.1 hypothetical protein BHL47_16430 [Bacillus cereus]PFQ65441.1 hypothetical protein COK18_08655 [Bacillus cereus]